MVLGVEFVGCLSGAGESRWYVGERTGGCGDLCLSLSVSEVATKPHPRSKGRNQTSSSMYTDLDIKEYHQQLKYEKKGY